MTFDPVKINLQQTQYQCGGRKSVCVTTEVCFVYNIKSDNQDANSAAGEPLSVPFLHLYASSLRKLLCFMTSCFLLRGALQTSATI